MTQPEAGCEDLLRAATVALEVPVLAGAHPVRATGFFVAPGMVATCAHVLGDTRERLPERVRARLMVDGLWIELETAPEWYLRDGVEGLDLAFLRVPDTCDTAHVLLSGVMVIGDPMWSYGHPAGLFRAGQSAAFTYQGPSRMRAAEEQWEPLRVAGTPVGGGYSGSPVLNQRTGAVCGMLCLSDEAGSAHMVSATDIIARCEVVRQAQVSVASNLRWLSTLSDGQIRAGGWQLPGPRMREYLDTAVRAAQAHPYPGVVPGITPPPLTAVYLHQQAETRIMSTDETTGPAFSEVETLPAEAILERKEDCVLIGNPGAGKSSLLRAALIALAHRWQQGQTGTEIPVYVFASDILQARPLPEAIASGTTANLSTVGLLRPWPAEFFDAHPLPGVRWLVLVDGLDEILDPKARRRVLEKLAGFGRSNRPSPYRFIVATRPLPSTEFPAESSWTALRYELQPFAADQLGDFAEGWFTELELAQPREAAGNFARELERAQLTDPARTPLMATMLCQLFAVNSDRPLPAGRAGAYSEFVELLRARQYIDTTSGIYSQMEAALGPYGPGATDAAAGLLTHAVDLIARLALARQDGDTRPAIQLLADWTTDRRPQHVPETTWRSFLREILRRSGLLTERANDFLFIHQTVSEFLAARHIAADAQRSMAVFHELLERWTPQTRTAPESWDEPGWDKSYSRFLVAALQDKPDMANALRHLANDGGLPGCQFIADLAIDGAIPDPSIVEAAATTLVNLASDPAPLFSVRREAAKVLVQLGDPRGANLLAAMAADPSIHEYIRYRAAKVLVLLGDPRGADLLAAMAADSSFVAYVRCRAAEVLVQVGDPRAAEPLAAVAADADVDAEDRRRAAEVLAQLGPARAADLLAPMAADPTLDASSRHRAAEALAWLGDPRAAELLAATVAHAALDASARRRAVEAVVQLGGSRTVDLLATMAADPALDTSARCQAAEAVVRLGGSRAADLLTALPDPGPSAPRRAEPSAHHWAAEAVIRLGGALATDLLAARAADPTLDASDHCRVVEAMAWIGGPGGVDLLAARTVDPTLGITARHRAAEALAQFGGPQGVELLAVMAADPTLDASDRRRATEAQAWLVGLMVARLTDDASDTYTRDRAAQVIVGLGDRHGADLLAAMAADRTLDIHACERAAGVVVRLGDPRGADLLAAMAADRTLDAWARRWAGEVLAQVSDARGAELLAAMAADQTLDASDRCWAAEVLAQLSDPCGAELLAVMAADQTLDASDRCWAAEMLAQLSNPSNADLLTAIADDMTLHVYTRRDVAEALAQLGDLRGTELLSSMAADATIDNYARRWAAEALAQLSNPSQGPVPRQVRGAH